MSFQNYGICAKCGIPRTGPNQPSCLRCGTPFAAPVSKPVSKPIPASKPEPTAFIPPSNWGLATNVKRPRKSLPLKRILAAILIAGLVIAGFFWLSQELGARTSTSPTVNPTLSPLITPGPTPAGGIVVNPADLDCQNPVTSITTITLPTTVAATAQVTEMLDDKTVGTPFKVSNFTHQPDGTWVAKSSLPATDMAAACAHGGINPKSGVASFTDGLHSLQIIGPDQAVLAFGFYTVINLGSDTSPLPAASATVSSDPHTAAFAKGAIAICVDNTLYYSTSRSGACSGHGGVTWWTGKLGAAGPGDHTSSNAP